MFCHEEKYDRKGWVPEQIIMKNTTDVGIITKQYTAKRIKCKYWRKIDWIRRIEWLGLV